MGTTLTHLRGVALRAILLLFICSFGTKQNFAQTIYYVDFSATGNADGTTWTDAYPNLQQALLNPLLSSGDEIWVAKGTYRPAVSDQDSAFVLTDGVALYGSFAGTETAVSQRDLTQDTTYLDGDLLEDDNRTGGSNAENSRTIVYCKNVSSTTILDGFVISSGNAASGSDAFSPKASGGGIFIDASNANVSAPTIRNCTVRNNEALFGGAMFINGAFDGTASPTIDNCNFKDNYASNDGAAIYNSGFNSGTPGRGGNPTIRYCRFTGNDTNASGGAIFNGAFGGQTNPYYLNCTFDNNFATGNGGAIYNQGNSGTCDPLFVNCLFYENVGFSGGAIYNAGLDAGSASPTFRNCTFYKNEARDGGFAGAIYNNADNDGTGKSSTVVVNCIFEANEASKKPSVFRNIHSTPNISYTVVDLINYDSLNNGPGSNLTEGSGVIYQGDAKFIDPNNGDFHPGQDSDAYN
ncbi:MAG: hypothetical protein AAFO94_11925, partial [Bacteroidota bacterium]